MAPDPGDGDAAAERALVARVLDAHAYDYALARCTCSARGVTWVTHSTHVAELVLRALAATRRG